MPIYAYKALDKMGKEVKSTVNSDSEANAKQRIRAQGLMLVEIKEKTAGGGSQSKSARLFSSKKVSVDELALVTRQLSTLIKARIQIVEALQAIVNQIEHEQLKLVLSDIRTKVNEGSSLGKALSDHPAVFDTVYINMVEAGEASGTLDVVLVKLADFKESQVKLKNKVMGSMTYPLVMMFAGGSGVIFIFTFVIPKIAKLFESSKKELPFLTQLTIWFSNFLLNYWLFLIIGALATVYFVKKYLATKSGERRWHKIQLSLPIVGNIIRMINISRFSSTLSTLLSSNVPILASLNIVKNLVPNVWMKDVIEESRVAISEGASMTGPLSRSEYFPSLMTQMIKLGEQSGELESMLEIISENYQDQVDTKLTGLTALLEPVMMIALGIAVSVIVFSVIVPMMELNKIN